MKFAEFPNLDIFLNQVMLCPNIILSKCFLLFRTPALQNEKYLSISAWCCIEEIHGLVPSCNFSTWAPSYIEAVSTLLMMRHANRVSH